MIARFIAIFTMAAIMVLCRCDVQQCAASGPTNAPAPMFGINFANTGQSTLSGPTAKPTVAWQRNINASTYAPQSLALSSDGILYTPGLYALNAGTGETIWRPASGNRDSHPALNDAGQLFSFEGGTMRARTASNGALLWSSNTNASDGQPPRIGPDGTIYASTFAGFMTAYSPAGQIKWSMDVGSIQYGEISLIPAIDGVNNTFFAGGAGLRSVDASGNVRWSVNYTPLASSAVMLAPNGDVVWQRDSLVERRDPSSGVLKSSFSSSSSLVSSDSVGNLYFSNGYVGITKTTPSGQTIWNYNHFGADWPVTVDAVGNAFCGDEDGNLIALSGTDGSELWRIKLSNSYPFLYNTRPVIGPNGQLFVVGLNQVVTALVPVPEPQAFVLLTIGIFGLSRVMTNASFKLH